MVWFLATLWLLMKDAFLVGAGNGSLPVDGTMSYMASIPLIALLVLGAQKLLSVVQRSRLLGTVMIGILVVAFSILTFRQNILSTDEIAILKDAQHHEPASAILEYDLGLTYGQQSSLGESQAHFQRAVQLDPNFISAYMGLGKVLYEQGKLLEAAKAYESIRKPGRYAAVLENNLRGIYSILAIDQETILSKNPRDINAYFSLGIFYDKLGDVDRAIAAYQQVIELDPSDQAGLTVLALKFQGLIYQRLGLTEKAQQNFARVH